MRALELLAPAKNLECGIAAIDHGADAVYIGASRFGARAAAGNTVGDIARLCDYAHPFGVKVYVTVNTILYDEELDATRQLLSSLADAGVDAVLVQDMALLSMADSVGRMSLHASTQTDNRSPEKVRRLRDLGFSRVVLARELSAVEIAAIHREVPDVELEVFVHGALCVSYSGVCYASQHCFGRSANRGECAQFCRMKFSLLDASGSQIERDRYLLSLKDMNQSGSLQELVDAGATSFKIEGRLKDISYVKNVTAAYSLLLDEVVRRHPGLYCRSSWGTSRHSFTPDLQKTFNRGYTNYFLHGRQPDIVSFDTPKAMGEFVGSVKEIRHDSFNVAGVSAFANGDGLCFVNEDHQLEGFRANRVVGNRIYPHRMPQGLKAGMRLYRNSSQEFDRMLSRPSAERRIPVRISLRAVGQGFELSAETAHLPVVTCRLAMEHQQAQKSPRENIVRQLSRLGDTIFVCTDVVLPEAFDFFIPNSVLADMRRKLVEQLLDASVSRCRSSVSGFGKGRAGRIPSESVGGASGANNYLYNISNRLSREFYGAGQLSAYELRGGSGPIMQCRHCLRYSLGYCVKHGGKRPSWREPLSLQLGDGRRFRLEFDCQHCQMNVYAETR